MEADDAPPFPSSPSPLHDIMLQLSSPHIDHTRAAAMELRKLAKTSSSNRICIAQIGAIPRLIDLLASPDKETQIHAITALFNLTLRNDSNKVVIIAAKGNMEAVVNVLIKGSAMEARENAAALVCNLSKSEGKAMQAMVDMEDVYAGLVGVLRDGSARGKRDAAAAMYNLLLMSKSSVAMAVRARAIDPLLHIALDRGAGLVDESLALLTLLSGHHHDARCELRSPDSLQLLLGLLQSDGWSPPTKESACALLLLLCRHSFSASQTLLMLGALEPLSALAQCGTDRARRKAIMLLELL